MSEILNLCSYDPSDKCILITDPRTGQQAKYLEVAKRITWFRTYLEDMGFSGCIKAGDVKYLESAKKWLVKASVEINGTVISQITAGISDDPAQPDIVQYAVTKAIGRALNLAGFGTEMCGLELMETSICETPVRIEENCAKDSSSHLPMKEPAPSAIPLDQDFSLDPQNLTKEAIEKADLKQIEALPMPPLMKTLEGLTLLEVLGKSKAYANNLAKNGCDKYPWLSAAFARLLNA